MHANWKNPHLYVMLAADALLLVIAHFLAYQVRFDFALTAVEWRQFQIALAWLVPLKMYVYLRFGLYRGMWRYTGGRDIRRLAEATIIGLLMTAAMLFLVHRWGSFSRGVFLLDAVFSIFFLTSLRLTIRYRHFRKFLVSTDFSQIIQRKNRKPALVFASPDLSPSVLAPLGLDNQHKYNVLGVVLDTDAWNEPTFHQLPVLGIRDELAVALDANEVREVFVALSTAKEQALDSERAQALSLVRGLCRDRDIPCRTLSSVVVGLHDQTRPPLSGEEI